MTQVWKIGQLASATGLTVRALHHYDHMGLVRPSGRTAGGHRLYAESDVQRVYQVLALRQIGLPLDVIGTALDGVASLKELLIQHQSFLDERLSAIRLLKAQLATMVAAMPKDTTDPATVTDFLELIRKVVTMDDTVKKYFSDSQLADLAERREHIGEHAIAEVQASWADLLPRVQEAVDTGMDPTTPAAQELAQEWMELLHQFHGGDAGLRDGLYQMQAENAVMIEEQHGGPSSDQLDFIQRANGKRSAT